jgi:spermidine/putrescine transport system substrate-binding protein
MKRIAVVMLCVLALLFSAGTAIAAGELFLYNWSDYTAPDLIKKFEKETGIKVTLDIYDSNETLLAKMKSGGGAYDIIVPTHNFVTILIEEGLIQKVNAAEFKGYENIVDAMKGPPWDPKNEYTIPWNYGSTSFCLNTGAYNPAEESMDTLFNPPAELQGKIGMFDSSEENTNLALVYKGYPQCNEDPAQMQEILDLLLAQKPHVKVYSSEGIHERLVSEDVMMSGCWNGSAMRARKANPNIKYMYPKEGILGWADNLAVPTGAKNRENAIKFLEFMLQPENAALQTNFSGYANAIRGSEAFLKEELKGAPELTVPEGIPVHFHPQCSETAIRLLDKVWTKVKQ